MTDTLNDAAADPQQTIAELQRKLADRTAERDELLQQRNATADVLKVISRSAFDLDSALVNVCKTAARLCDADQAAIFRREGDLYHFAASFGFPQEYADAWRAAGPSPNDPKSKLVGHRAIAERRPVQVLDVTADPAFIASKSRASQSRTALGIPLMREDKPVGNFVLARRRVEAFTDRQLELLQTFADQAVIAMENTRLFQEVQAKTHDMEGALAQQTATAEVLKVISRSTFDLDSIFSALVSSARDLCAAPQSMILLVDGDKLRMVKQVGYPLAFEHYTATYPPAVSPTSGAGRAVYLRQIVQFPDVLADESYRYSEGQKIGGYRALLSVPLMRGEEAIGVFSLGRPTSGAFTPKQIDLVRTFADQAVIAIENARLWNELRERTADLGESLQVQTATADVLKVISRSAFDLQTVLDTLVVSAARLCDADRACIFQKKGDVYRWVSNFGFSPELIAYADEHPFTAGTHSTTSRVALEGKPIHNHDVLADPNYQASEYQRLGDYRTMLGIPLLREGVPIGVFILTRREVRPFSDRQIELVTGFADQAVIAIENVRLFNEVQIRTSELAASLDDLRTAQDRLVQTEKLASLGQLTAGIAHEIKNPLNFVNNFAALSAELTDELNEVLAPAPLDQTTRGDVNELTVMLKSNLEKVVQHGKRADSIVKNMLLHSREDSGENRSADINALLDESLNLAYHGARAEKPGFNITLQRDFDSSAGAIEVFPQEITRVFLNLISNGFYAATKRKAENDDADFEPMLSAATKNLGNRVEIRIRDNGTGIPSEVRENIFNPFFTTKPAGEGTGLGLSMSHDIIVKQHGGSIEVDTRPGLFTEFTVVLPRHSNIKN